MALPNIDLSSQSVVVDEQSLSNTKQQCSGTYRNKQTKDYLYGYDEGEQNTIYEIFENSCNSYPHSILFGKREKLPGCNKFEARYTWKTYSQIYTLVRQFSNGLYNFCVNTLKLEKSKLKNKDFTPIGIYSVNRTEWCITDFSCSRVGFVSVALFDTFGPETLEYVINHAELKVIVASKDKISGLLKIRDKLPGLKAIISMDKFDEDDKNLIEALKDWAEQLKVKLMDMDEISNMGVENQPVINHPKHNDLYTICYTSGTTGNPKGAMLNHISFSCGARGANANFPDKGNGSHISYLPLAHCFERLVQLVWIKRGCSIGFYTGNVMNLMEDIAILKPASFVSVPRLLNRVYDAVTTKTINQDGIKGRFARYAVHKKLSSLREGRGVENMFLDKLLFNKIKGALGGNIKSIVTGSAPLSDEVLDFLRVSFGCFVVQGYGLTETSAALCATLDGEYRPGHCGPPLPCCEVKLLDIPEMNYRSSDKPLPRGEILVRGQNLFVGYYKEEQKTKEVLDDDGWFHTGDIGAITEYGTIAVIDRKKNIFKLSQGEYIAPEKIEGIYQQSRYVMQAFVYGDSLKSYLIGILVLDEAELLALGREQTGESNASYEDLIKNDKVKSCLLEEINKHAKDLKLNGFELLKKIHIEKNAFTIDNGMMTPTFKLKRQVISEKYSETIKEMYDKDSS